MYPIRMGSGSRTSPTAGGKDPAVEELLRSAEDELILTLRVNTHTSSASSLDPDFSRRFEALKPSPPQRRQQSSRPTNQQNQLERQEPAPLACGAAVVDDELSGALGRDLAARFAALKASSSAEASGAAASGHKSSTHEIKCMGDDDDGDDEVEKLLKWATDAARLSPLKSSYDDDDNDDDDDNSGNDEDDDAKKHLKVEKMQQSIRRGGGGENEKRTKKRFFF